MTMGELKQEILRINNKVNIEIFDQGLITQKIDVLTDKVILVATNRRVKMISAVEHRQDTLTAKIMDIALIIEFKTLFLKIFEEELGIRPWAHFKDYDSELETSTSVTLFSKPVADLLPEIEEYLEERKSNI